PVVDAGAGDDSSSAAGWGGHADGAGSGGDLHAQEAYSPQGHSRCAGSTRGAGVGLRAGGCADGWGWIWNGNFSALGGDLYQCAGRAMERDAAGCCAASSAGVRGVVLFDPG